MDYEEQLLKKISSHTAKIGIIGLGYAGLPLGLTFTLLDELLKKLI